MELEAISPTTTVDTNYGIYYDKVAYTDKSGKNKTVDIPVVDIPAGTMLFRGIQLPNPANGDDGREFVRDWLGKPMGGRFCMTPTHNTFFYTSPFVPFGAHTVGKWFNAIMICVTVKDTKLVSLINPSQWTRGEKEIKDLDGTAPIQRCDRFDYSCLSSEAERKEEKKRQQYDICINPSYAKDNNVNGWMAIAGFDSLDDYREGKKGKDTTMGTYLIELESRIPKAGAELLLDIYTDHSNHRGFPEVVLNPWYPHPGNENQYTEAGSEEEAADVISQISDRFVYLPVAIITERGILEAFTGDFKAADLPMYAAQAIPGPNTRAVIDKLQYQYLLKLKTEGVQIPGVGLTKMRFDNRTGFYLLNKFFINDCRLNYSVTLAGKPPKAVKYDEFIMSMATPELYKEYLEYKIKYRTLMKNKLLLDEELLSTFDDRVDKDGKPLHVQVARAFIFERPLTLKELFQELGIPMPKQFIPYISAAIASHARDLYDKSKGRDKVKLEDVKDALKRANESLDILAGRKEAPKPKAVREAEAKRLASLPPLPKETVLAPPPAPGIVQTKPVPVIESTTIVPTEETPKEEVGELQKTIRILRSKQEAFNTIQQCLSKNNILDGADTIYEDQYQNDNLGLKFSMGNYGKDNFNPRDMPVQAFDGPWVINQEAIQRTLDYLYDKLHHTCYLLCVKNHIPTLYKLEGGSMPSELRTILEKDMTEKGVTDINLDNTRIMQCIIKPYKAESTTADEWLGLFQEMLNTTVGQLDDQEMEEMSKMNPETRLYKNFVEYSRNFILPNGVFILNLTDANILRNDYNEPWGYFTKGLRPLEEKYNGKEFLPIFSYSGNDNYFDIPIPNFDDLFEIKYKRAGQFIQIDEEATLGTKGFEVSRYGKSIPKAVFRGGTTGCGWTTETNMRLKITSPEFLATLQNRDMLDVGVTTITKQYKMDPKYGLGKVDPSKVQVVQPLTLAEQAQYNYIIHIDGNVHAYRLLKTMMLGSCILRVDSQYKSWGDTVLVGFNVITDEELDEMERTKTLEEYHNIRDDYLQNLGTAHYIHVERDLSNLDRVLEWCKGHYYECLNIGERGRNMARLLLDRKYLFGSICNLFSEAFETCNRHDKQSLKAISDAAKTTATEQVSVPEPISTAVVPKALTTQPPLPTGPPPPLPTIRGTERGRGTGRGTERGRGTGRGTGRGATVSGRPPLPPSTTTSDRGRGIGTSRGIARGGPRGQATGRTMASIPTLSASVVAKKDTGATRTKKGGKRFSMTRRNKKGGAIIPFEENIHAEYNSVDDDTHDNLLNNLGPMMKNFYFNYTIKHRETRDDPAILSNSRQRPESLDLEDDLDNNSMVDLETPENTLDNQQYKYDESGDYNNTYE